MASGVVARSAMRAISRLSSLSDVQSWSWRLVAPFLLIHLLVNAGLAVAYWSGLADMIARDEVCQALGAIKPSLGATARFTMSLDAERRLCRLFTPIAVVNGVAVLAYCGFALLVVGAQAFTSKFFYGLVIISFLPLMIIQAPERLPTTSLGRGIQSGSAPTYFFFLICIPLFSAMCAAGTLQSYRR